MAQSLVNITKVTTSASFNKEPRGRRMSAGTDVFAADTDAPYNDAVCWEAFEDWWKTRTGDIPSSMPVLPESLVGRVDDLSQGTGRALGHATDVIRGEKFEDGQAHPSTAKHRWKFLGQRLWLLMHMSGKLWGDLYELYPGTFSGYIYVIRIVQFAPVGLLMHYFTSRSR